MRRFASGLTYSKARKAVWISSAWRQRKNTGGGFIMRFTVRLFAVAAWAFVALAAAVAQDYPTKAIRFVQPFPPGGAVDTISRLVGERLSARFGQQVVVDNRPGANGAIAVNVTTSAPADGYTIMAVAQAFLTHQSTYRDFKMDVRKDITPVILGATFPLVLVVHPGVPARSVAELI